MTKDGEWLAWRRVTLNDCDAALPTVNLTDGLTAPDLEGAGP